MEKAIGAIKGNDKTKEREDKKRPTNSGENRGKKQ